MIKQITSKQNQCYKLAKLLSQRKGRDEKGLFILEGIRNFEEIVKSDFKIEAALFSTSFRDKDKAGTSQLLHSLGRNINSYEVPDTLFHELALTENPQGVLLIVRKKTYSLEEVIYNPRKFLIIADGIQDPGNMGTIVRTAAAAGAGGLLLTSGCVDVYNPKVIRSTMGGIFHLPVVEIENRNELIDAFEKHKYSIVVADVKGQFKYYQVNLQGAVALVIGNENKGPSPEFLQKAHLKVKIPLIGPVESLNAAVASGILIYEVVRQRSL